MHRRNFLAGGLAGSLTATSPRQTLAAAAQGAPAAAEPILNEQPGMKYRAIPGLGIALSEVSLGGQAVSPDVHGYAVEQGVNLVHMAMGYLGGRAIQILGEFLKTDRDKVYVAMKDDYRDIDGVLKTLNTDHVDFLMYNRHDPESVEDPRILEDFEKLKSAGKARWAGVTIHGRVKETTAAAIECGFYSLINPVLSQPSLETLDPELRLAREKGLGVLAFKSMQGLSGSELQMAYLKKLLGNPAVTSVLKTIDSFDAFDEYLESSHQALTVQEDRMLYRYAQANRSRNCMMCDDCRMACPQGIEVSTVLRSKDYYYAEMGDYQMARSAYFGLPEEKRWNAGCEDCHLCETACPNGIHIVPRLLAAREFFATTA